MKLRRALPLLLIGLGSSAIGAALDTLDGYVYYESGRTIARSTYAFAATFTTGGTFAELYRRSSGIIGSSQADRLVSPASGAFVYRKINDTAAELTLVGADSGGKRTLRFSEDLSGEVSPDNLALFAATFRLARIASRSPLLACSNRSFVTPKSPAFAGFVITGEADRTVLVRAVGPGLAPFGVADYLRNPVVTVTRSRDNRVVGTNDDWSSESAESIGRTSALAGTFPLPAASKDAATILVLPPGAYVAQVASPDAADSGQALVEVYMLP